MRKPVLSLCPSLCPRADLKALSGGQDQLHRLTSLLAHRGGLHQGKAHWLDLPLQPLPPSIKTTGRLLRSLHRTPLPSSHFAADGQSVRPSTSFAPPPALGCSCHHYAPVNSLRVSGVHRMLTANRRSPLLHLAFGHHLKSATCVVLDDVSISPCCWSRCWSLGQHGANSVLR
jgi:hypothetical protein